MPKPYKKRGNHGHHKVKNTTIARTAQRRRFVAGETVRRKEDDETQEMLEKIRRDREHWFIQNKRKLDD